jgi:hypothetical protein
MEYVEVIQQGQIIFVQKLVVLMTSLMAWRLGKIVVVVVQ